MAQYPYYPFNLDLGAVVTLTAASTGGNSANLNATGTSGVRVNVNVSAISGTSATLTVTVQGYDVASNSYFTLLQSAGITATGMTSLVIQTGTTAAANSVANVPVSPIYRVLYTITGTTPSVTGTIGVEQLI